MNNNIHMDEVEKGWKTIYLIWLAMLIALFIYLLVGLSLGDLINISINKGSMNIVRYVLYGISAVTFFSIKYIRNYILNTKNNEANAAVSYNPSVFKYIKATIASLALAESIALYGLVLFILGKNSLDLYLLIFVSAAAMIIYRPFKEHIIKLAEETKAQ